MSVKLLTQAAPTAGPLTRAALEEYFHAAAKPRDRWRVGAEFEKFAVDRATGRPLTYDEPGGIRDILARLAERFGWQPYRNETGHLVALARGGATVSLEPGGQVELSTAASLRLADIDAQLATHLAELRAASDERVAWLAVGVEPLHRVEALPLMPRVRHAVMAQYLPLRSPTALLMMKATASTQVALDFADEADAATKFATAMKLGPVLNALFSNAPLLAGVRTENVSVRGAIWSGMDPDRSGLLVPLLEGGFSFGRWVEYLLDVPMMFTCIGGRYRPADGRTFREYMQRGVDGYFPTGDDWETHLTTVFPEVRLKSFLEIRGADATPRALALAVPALWKGLLYDPAALAAAATIATEIRPADLPGLFVAAYRAGLEVTYRGRSLGAWCRDLTELAAAGLPADERPLLDPVREVLARGRSPGAEFFATGPSPAADPASVVRWFEYDVPFYQI